MPDESCRNCGVELHVQSTCSTCREPIQQICPECRYVTLERIHTRCTSGLERMSMLEPPVQILPIITT